MCPLRVARSVGWWADSGDVATSDQQATPSYTTPGILPTFSFIVHLRLLVSIALLNTTHKAPFMTKA